MLSVVIPTHESERALVPTLAALVPGATAGLVAEVVIADGESSDATEEVADIAGCRFLRSPEPFGPRLAAAARTTRAPWLLFMRPGIVPEPRWVSSVEQFMQAAADGDKAATFRRPATVQPSKRGWSEVVSALRTALGGAPSPEQGLLIPRRLYDQLGGHTDGPDPEAALLRRLGRRRLTVLAAAAG